MVVAWNTTGLVPNAALIDAAHRNGARCLGTIFQPDKRMFDGTDWSREDVAKRLVHLAQYFGFDGYFVNFESYSEDDARGMQDVIEAMQEEARTQNFSDFHIQYYNGHTDVRAVWPGPPHADGSPRPAEALRANSMMVDQGWSNYGLTRGCCSGIPLKTLPNPLETGGGYDPMDIYYGLQLYPGPGYLGLMAPVVITPNGGPASGSLQIYSAEDGLRKMRRARHDWLKASTSLSPQERQELTDFANPEIQRKMWYKLHGQFWSGKTGNPARNNTPTQAESDIYGRPDIRKIYTDYEAPGKPTDQLRLPITYGVANFITERSVIGRLPFVTHFNTGEGDRFFRDGLSVAETPWFNLGIQDILPTWAWWNKPLDRPLDPDRGAVGLLEVDYDFRDAYDGGTSLCVSGRLSDQTATELKLFKTQIPVTKDSTLGLVCKGGDNGVMTVGLVFEDAPDVTQWLPVLPAKGRMLKSGWTQVQVSLAPFSGRTLAVVSLGFAPLQPHKDNMYTIHIGELTLTSGTAPAPAKPEGFKLIKSHMDAAKQSAELQLGWVLDPSVAYYDILAVNGQEKTWLGRITGNAYYVSALKRDGTARQTVLHLVPASRDGRMSDAKAAKLTFSWV
ncbi:MAG: hypothetical protein WBQ60_01020 [Asticcacaulis sp.]